MNKKNQKTIKKYMQKRGLVRMCDDGGCGIVEVSNKDLVKPLVKISKAKTIDEFTGRPEGSFKKWIIKEKKKLAKMEQERKDRIRKRTKI